MSCGRRSTGTGARVLQRSESKYPAMQEPLACTPARAPSNAGKSRMPPRGRDSRQLERRQCQCHSSAGEERHLTHASGIKRRSWHGRGNARVGNDFTASHNFRKLYSVHVRTRKLRTSEMPLISGSTRQSIFGFSRGRSILAEQSEIFHCEDHVGSIVGLGCGFVSLKRDCSKTCFEWRKFVRRIAGTGFEPVTFRL